MAEFICRNDECRNYNVSIHIGDVTYRMRDMALVADERFCKLCGMEMEEIKIHKGVKSFNISEINNPDKDFTRMGSGKPIY